MRLFWAFGFSAALTFAHLTPARGAAPAAPGDPQLTIYRDENGMPRCLFRRSDNRLVQFLWTADMYEREVYARDINRYSLDTTVNSRTPPKLQDALQHICSWGSRIHLGAEPEELSLHPMQPRSRMMKVDEDTSEVFGLELSPSMHENFRFVRQGMIRNLPDGIDSVEDFLTRYPITKWTRSLNRQLTNRYGVGFTTALYKTWLEAKPYNNALKAKIIEESLGALPTEQSKSNVPTDPNVRARLAAVFRNRVYVLVPGLVHDAGFADRFDVLKIGLGELGAEVIEAPTSGLGDMAKNMKIVRRILEDLMNRGKRITVLTLSKGGVEAAWALTELADRIDAKQPNDGSVDSMINFSAVLGPSFLIHKITNPLEWLVARGQLRGQLQDGGNDLGNFVGFKQLREGYMSEKRRMFLEKLPRSVRYINIVGAIEGSGLSNDIYDRGVQDDAIRSLFRRGFGANDTYLEYPYMTLDRAYLPHNYEVVMNGTHGLIVAEYNGFWMGDPRQRNALFSGLVLATDERVRDGK